MDFLISADGLRADRIDVTLSGVRLTKQPSGFAPKAADLVTGTVLLTLADLTAVLARPEVVNQLLARVAGLAKPDLKFSVGDRDGVRLTGSVEFVGRRFPISAHSHVHIEDNQLIISATHIQGLPVVKQVPVQFFDLVLPLKLPTDLTLTGVTVEEGGLLVAFEGRNVRLS